MGRKIIVTNLNDPNQIQLWDVVGFEPENYLFDAPADAERIDDLDIDLNSKMAVINEKKLAARIAVEDAARALMHAEKQQELAELTPIAEKIDSGAKLSDSEMQIFLKSAKKRMGL